MKKIDSLKSSISIYLDEIVGYTKTYIYENSIQDINIIDNLLDLLNEIKRIINNTNNYDDLFKIKERIYHLEDEIEYLILANKYHLSSREEGLVIRGYNDNLVRALCFYSEKEAYDIALVIYNELIKDCKRVSNPICIFLGGQPGSGKSVLSSNIKNSSIPNGIIPLGIDNYRTYHPNYLLMEEVINEHWRNREETNNDSMGNDIADFTHSFAGRVTDILTEMVSKVEDNKAYNIVFEWGMRSPYEPLKTMRELYHKGYTNNVNFLVVHEDISRDACKIRTNIMDSSRHIIRKVSDSFHDSCVQSLPSSAELIYSTGIKEKIINDFLLTNRDGNILWDKTSNQSISKLYYEYLHNKELSHDVNIDI